MKTEELGELIYARFENLIFEWDKNRHVLPAIEFRQGSRNAGVHASSLLASDKDFCYREQVLSFSFKPKGGQLSASLLRIFLEGNAIHLKWQMLFTVGGLAVAIERQGHNEESNLSYTPDAVIKLFGRLWVVEIKSMNTFAFQKLTKAPQAAIDQLSIYMMEEKVPQGIVLVEDKNNQNFRVWPIKYDPDSTRRPIKRLKIINKVAPIYKSRGKLPKRLCSSKDIGRAKRCQFAAECFSR